MAHESQPYDIRTQPPPYQSSDATNFRMPYQQQQPPPPPNYGVPPPIPVYTQTTTIVRPWGIMLGHYPQPLQCPSCHQQIVTRVDYEPGGGTWLISLLICVFGGFLGCCLIPFCVPACQDAVHICPLCNTLIGRRNVF
ncbi:unnamed protein product [Rotaria sordida]|uniref:LITAF domain-containing protein n=1 Tax=Rotaria sordida TaxID=392033 RepID=A0A818V493_9BILA|nr:unnamed protein product [Rotaria sordida]CAF1214364.1 unnamed protein product [Rotaria sordida]CAF3709745.1 unnamed protein product [Rotaria sordida]CAF3940247.1 unnamed protein product [Rotaria sordida]